MNPMPPLAAHIVAAIIAIATLLASQSLIDNRTEKLVVGLAGVLLPIGFEVANAIHHAAKARVHAAKITAAPAAAPAARPRSARSTH